MMFAVGSSIGVVAFFLSQRDRLVIALVSHDMARTSGIAASRLSLLYLTTFSITVALGLRYLGVLLWDRSSSFPRLPPSISRPP
jgi:ABC-type Mn2+/Zn2+ transport system permease subunit